MIAEGVRDTELGAYQRAVRLVLTEPLVTATRPNADALTLVRRFAGPLARDLDEVAGYRLDVAPTCVRLIRRLDRLDPTQAVQLKGGGRKPFDRRRYAYLALVLGALGRAGRQVALTELADALRRRAAEVDGLGFDPDDYRHRLAFVDVVTHLDDLGALQAVEVSSVAWLRDPEAGEALYDVDRDVVHLLFAPPRVLQHVHSAGALLEQGHAASRDTRRAETRQRLARLLLEHPVVYFDDLDDADREYLVRQARSLGEDLHRLTGGQLERRAEGVALVDATGGFSDRRFPAGGTPGQVALLLADAMTSTLDDQFAGGSGAVGWPVAAVPTVGVAATDLITTLDSARPPGGLADLGSRGGADLVEPVDGVDLDDPDDPDDLVDLDDRGHLRDVPPAPGSGSGNQGDGMGPTGPFFPHAWLVDQAARLCRTHGRAFAADLRNDPPALAARALRLLADFDLVRPVPGGVVARPALARYRHVRVEVAPSPQIPLFELPEEPAS